MSVVKIIQRSSILTVEGAFCDSLKCMYWHWIAKHEVQYTSLFSPLLDLGNESLPLFNKAKNMTYRSEQIKGEMIVTIGCCIEHQFLRDVVNSPYFSIIIDEATDVSVHKQLGICVQYIDCTSGSIMVRFLGLLEISQGTADEICETFVNYISLKAPVVLDLQKMAGGATDSASVMVGSRMGVVTRIKDMVPKFISTHCSVHRLSLAASDSAD